MRWYVRLDGKGKWLMKAACLKKIGVEVICFRNHTVSIVGSWDNWKKMLTMSYDADRRYYYSEARCSKEKEASFQILLDADWMRCLHPDRCVCHGQDHNLCGPDANGKGKNWDIGNTPNDRISEGDRFKIMLHVTEDGSPQKVDWTRLAAGNTEEPIVAQVQAMQTIEAQGAKQAATLASISKPDDQSVRVQLPRYKSVAISSSFDGWKVPHEMTWDESCRCYRFRIPIGPHGWENFQFIVDGDWKKCVHPDEGDACPYLDYMLCGPDSNGHDKNWAIGLHPLDRGGPRASYEVRLLLADNGDPKKVDWVRLDRDGKPDLSEPEVSPPVKLPSYKAMKIVGTWNEWKEPLEMTWDKDRRCYHFNLVMGVKKEESFQLWLDGDSKRCLHPHREDGSPYTENRLCGPDSFGNGKNWTIGLHMLEKPARGVRYEVRLFLTEDGSAKVVDWVKIRQGSAVQMPN